MNKAVAVRWALSHLDRFQQLILKDFFAELRLFINIELHIDNARPENLLGPAGTWVKSYRKQMEEEGPKASGPRNGGSRL